MKTFTLLGTILALVIGPAFAGGTAGYTTSRVTITGLYDDWGDLQESTLYQSAYSIRASNSPLASVTISGDSQITIDASACPGAQSCTATASLTADVGGDYSATITGTSSNAVRVHGSSSSHSVKTHVIGANYVLVGADNGNATATFTLNSTGETDLLSPTFAAATNTVAATIVAVTCGDLVPSGKSCQVTVAAQTAGEGGGVYVTLQAFGNTRQQDPVRVNLVLPAAE